MAYSWPVRVYIEDTDFGGIVYYVNYLKFMERARTELLREVDCTQEQLKKRGLIFVVAEVSSKYLAPARLDDLLRIDTEILQVKGAKIRFLQQAVRESDQRLLCEAQVDVVSVSAKDLRPKRWPEELLKSIQLNLPGAWRDQE